MSPQSSSLLIAVEAEELFRRFETYIYSDLRAGRDLRALHCRPEQTDSTLREHDTDAVIVIQPRFHDELPAAVRRWKEIRFQAPTKSSLILRDCALPRIAASQVRRRSFVIFHL